MEKYLNIISLCGFFKDIKEVDLVSMLNCVQAKIRKTQKDEFVLLAGAKPEQIGIVLEGQLNIVREDYDGNRTMVTAVMPGDVYSEALCCAGVLESPVSVIAEVESAIMQISYQRILRVCPNTCTFHIKLIENMLELIAQKNLYLQSRMDIISLKSVRMKVLRYFESLIPKQGKKITVPFNREELADFLCVERSALSHELARMKKDGLIEYRKNKFVLK